MQSLSIHTLLALLGTSVCSLSAGAGTITVSNSAPVVDGGDVANLTWTDSATIKTFADAVNPGQSFTTGSDAGYVLNSLSLQVNSNSNTDNPPGERMWTLRVIEIDPNNTDSSTVAIEVDSVQSAGTEWSAGDWFTFDLDTPVNLASDTLYGFDIEHTAGTDWPNGIPYFRENRSDDVAGAYRYTKADGDPSTLNAATGRDMVFHADMSVVPEPTSLVLGLGLGGLLIARRRRG